MNPNISIDPRLARLQTRIAVRKGILGCGEGFSIALHSRGDVLYVGENRYGQQSITALRDVLAVSCGRNGAVALMRDGTVRGAGFDDHACPELRAWANVRAVTCGHTHVAALWDNGEVRCCDMSPVPDRAPRACMDTEGWRGVVDVCCGEHFTAGLTATGTVLMAGGPPRLRHTVSKWQRIAGLFSDFEGRELYAITEGGQLISTTRLPRAVRAWRNLLFVAANRRGILAVTAAGRLCSTLDEALPERGTGDACVACAVGADHATVLKKDGHVMGFALSAHMENYGQCATARWGVVLDHRSMEEYCEDRETLQSEREAAERVYQERRALSVMCRRRIACGERMTACITAEGGVSASAPLPRATEWRGVIALAVGHTHLLALHAGGRVSADGNDVGGCCRVEDWTAVKAVAAGKYYSLALHENGSVSFAGMDKNGLSEAATWTSVRLIRAADEYAVGVTHGGAFLVAGNAPFSADALSAMMNGTPQDVVITPTHAAVLYPDGRVYTTRAACGDTNSINPADKRTEIECDTHAWRDVRAIAAGENFTVGLCYGGRVLAVGDNGRGQCDTETWSQVVSVHCGRSFTAGLRVDGRVLVAGQRQNGWGYTPFAVSQWQDVVAISCGAEHIVAVDRRGNMLADGADTDRQCAGALSFSMFRDLNQLYGYGCHRPAEPSKEDVHTDGAADAPRLTNPCIAIGMTHIAYLAADGRVITTGAERRDLSDTASWTDATLVAAGPYHTAALLEGGRVAVSGRDVHIPADVKRMNDELCTRTPDGEALCCIHISCGYRHIAAVRSDGRVFAIGLSPDGRCDTEAWENVAKVACGVRHTVGLLRDGTCVAVGDNQSGQCNVDTWRDVVAVAAGEFHTVGLTSDGRVLAAGDDRYGQCQVKDLADVVAVACIPEATLCLHRDGRVSLRGGAHALHRDVAAIRDAVAIAGCEHRLCVLTSDGSLTVMPDPVLE